MQEPSDSNLWGRIARALSAHTGGDGGGGRDSIWHMSIVPESSRRSRLAVVAVRPHLGHQAVSGAEAAQISLEDDTAPRVTCPIAAMELRSDVSRSRAK